MKFAQFSLVLVAALTILGVAHSAAVPVEVEAKECQYDLICSSKDVSIRF